MRIVREAKHKAKKLQRKLENKNKIDLKQKDKNKVWAFCSGQYSNDFRGNPKFLFIYIIIDLILKHTGYVVTMT